MKYLKLFENIDIEWEEDWEEDEPTKTQSDDCENIKIGDRYTCSTSLIDPENFNPLFKRGYIYTVTNVEGGFVYFKETDRRLRCSNINKFLNKNVYKYVGYRYENKEINFIEDWEEEEDGKEEILYPYDDIKIGDKVKLFRSKIFDDCIVYLNNDIHIGFKLKINRKYPTRMYSKEYARKHIKIYKND